MAELKPLDIHLVPPFHKGDGQNFAEFTIYVEGGTPFILSPNDRIRIENYELKVCEKTIKYAPNLFDEFFSVKVHLITNNVNGKFELNNYLKPLVIKLISMNYKGMVIPDPTSSLKIIHRP